MTSWHEHTRTIACSLVSIQVSKSPPNLKLCDSLASFCIQSGHDYNRVTCIVSHRVAHDTKAQDCQWNLGITSLARTGGLGSGTQLSPRVAGWYCPRVGSLSIGPGGSPPSTKLTCPGDMEAAAPPGAGCTSCGPREAGSRAALAWQGIIPHCPPQSLSPWALPQSSFPRPRNLHFYLPWGFSCQTWPPWGTVNWVASPPPVSVFSGMSPI